MILVLNGADFSQNNLGQVEITTILDDFTKAAISASGNNNMTDTQKGALNTFFKNIGAFGNKSDIFNKLSYLYIPMISGDVAHSMNNYINNDNTVQLDNTKVTLQENGLTPTVNDYFFRVEIANPVDITNLSVVYMGTYGNYTDNNCPIVSFGSSAPGRFLLYRGKTGAGNCNIGIFHNTGQALFVNTLYNNFDGEIKNDAVVFSSDGDESVNAHYINNTDKEIRTYTFTTPETGPDRYLMPFEPLGQSPTSKMNMGYIHRFLAVGTSLTTDEMFTIKQECEKLRDAFVVE